MIILNTFALFCIILVTGNTIPVEEGSTNLPPTASKSSPPVLKNEKPQYNCSLPHMTVSGFDMKLSEVVSHECWSIASNIQIVAINKIFIDCDVTKNSVQLSIYAPTWEIIGKRKIVLSGNDGDSHEYQTASSNGTNGEPGLPGDAGGVFIGFGEHIINASKLKIRANGGNGGPGQNGATGISRINGDEFKEDSRNTKMSPEDFFNLLNEMKLNYTYTSKVTCSMYGCDLIRTFDIIGKMANTSGDGGDGGAGGLGGPAGFIYMSGFDSMPNVERDEGKNGTAGNGGLAGYPARNGRNVNCVIFQSLPNFLKFFLTDCKHDDFTWGSVGKKGIDGGNEVNRKTPPNAMNPNQSDMINLFKQFIKKSLINNDKESNSTKFIDNLLH